MYVRKDYLWSNHFCNCLLYKTNKFSKNYAIVDNYDEVVILYFRVASLVWNSNAGEYQSIFGGNMLFQGWN